VVSSERLFQPTQLARPGEAALERERFNHLDQLIIDDGRTGSNLPVRFNGQDNSTTFSARNPLRTGQAISGLEGVMHYGFGHYRLQPTRPLQIDAGSNPRSAAPNVVGGALRAAEFNVLSYFSTLNESLPVCGPLHDQRCRGANDLTEQSLQMQKLVAALIAIDADILALIELENDSAQSLQDFTNALNSAAGEKAWAFVRTGTIGQDAIKVGLLFKPMKVTAIGDFAILNRAVDARFNDALNRPALAQTFRIKGAGSLLTVVATHLKSKSCADAGEPDTARNDGQSCFNQARTDAAAALADWALSDPTGYGNSQVLILGDFNSYRMEDPVRAMQSKGLIDLLGRSADRNAYTYVYQGLAGTLDYAFASPDLTRHVTGITAWHINADESEILDYRGKTGMPDAYQALNPYRSSDHDPVIVGLNPVSPHANYEKPLFEEDSSILRYTLLAGALVLFVVGAWGLR
jgi:predicted extracellular nuclease